MKVLFVTPYYYPNLAGGSERSLKILAEGLVKKGFAIEVLSFDSDGGDKLEKFNGVKIIRLEKPKIKPATLAYNIGLIKARKRVIESKPDIIHVYNTWQIPASYFFRKCAKVIATLNNYYPLISTSYTSDNLIEKGKSSVYQKSKSIFATSKGNSIKHFFSSIFFALYSCPVSLLSKKIDGYIVYASPIKDIYVRNGFNKHKFVTIPSPIEKKCKVGKKKRERSALYVGGCLESKGFYELVSALDFLEGTGIQVDFVGVKNVPKKIQDRVSKLNLKVRFIEPVTHEKLKGFYQRAGVFVRPALWPEPFARVIVESLESDTPIISSDNPVAKEILRGAIFYRRGHPRELAEKIKKFLDGEITMDLNKIKKRVFSCNPIEKTKCFYEELLK